MPAARTNSMTVHHAMPFSAAMIGGEAMWSYTAGMVAPGTREPSRMPHRICTTTSYSR